MDEQLRLYQPRSDFLISKSTLPRLPVEVKSNEPTEWPPDLIRMLLQGAAIVRFANTFFDAFRGRTSSSLLSIFGTMAK